MGQPWGIAFGKNGMWAVADWFKHCVYVFDGQDQLIRKIGSKGSGNGKFNRSEGVTFNSCNCLYVVDNGNNRIQKLDSDSNYLLKLGGYGFRNG